MPLDLPFIAGLHKVSAPADFIVVTTPSDSATEGMIGKRDLALMRKRCIDDFVTIAMGPVAAAYAEDIKVATFPLPRASTSRWPADDQQCLPLQMIGEQRGPLATRLRVH